MSRTTRRSFLGSSITTGAALAAGSRALGAPEARPAAKGVPATLGDPAPGNKLNIAIVGVHGRGGSNMKAVGSENIVALCDVDDRYLDAAAEAHPKARRYNDWRKMLQQKDIDAVVVSTTEHTHAPIAVTAMRLKKHVFCEKPLAHTVHEARIMAQTAASARVATQMGTQIHATENYRRVVELVKSGAIGAVKEAHVWCDRTPIGQRGRPEGSEPVPPHLHWDLWLGPAPYRPYHPAYLPGCLTWDKIWDFGNGTLGDMGSHLIDLPFWALDLRHPATAEAQGDPREDETYPKWLTARWEHPARGGRPAVNVFWYDGGKRPPAPEGIDLTNWKIGVIFVGDKGTLVADYGRKVLLPEERYRDFQPPQPSIPPSPGHHQEWIHACKTGAPTLCNFDYSGALVEHNLLGCVAFRVGQKLQWDPVNLKASNCPAADRFLRKTYRSGWEWI